MSDRDPSETPEISVIVPVWNDARRLALCLEALAAQTFPAARFEVIVIDNGSTDGSGDVARAAAASEGGPRIVALEEPEPGSYHARARGLAAAAGRHIAFTDSDCVPAPGWLEAALAAADEGSGDPVGLVAGRIEIFEEERSDGAKPSRAAFDYERLFSFDQARNVERGVAVTANWLSPRAAIDAAGGFDVSVRSGGDWRLARAIAAAGWRVVYAPDAVVGHPARAVAADLLDKRRRVVGGAWAAESGPLRAPRLAWRAFADWARKTLRALGSDKVSGRRKIGVLAVVAKLFATVLIEIARLSAGGAPRR